MGFEPNLIYNLADDKGTVGTDLISAVFTMLAGAPEGGGSLRFRRYIVAPTSARARTRKPLPSKVGKDCTVAKTCFTVCKNQAQAPYVTQVR